MLLWTVQCVYTNIIKNWGIPLYISSRFSLHSRCHHIKDFEIYESRNFESNYFDTTRFKCRRFGYWCLLSYLEIILIYFQYQIYVERKVWTVITNWLVNPENLITSWGSYWARLMSVFTRYIDKITGFIFQIFYYIGQGTTPMTTETMTTTMTMTTTATIVVVKGIFKTLSQHF